MKLSSYLQFANELLTDGIDQACAHAKATGFDGVEFLEAAPYFADSIPAELVKETLAKYDLTVPCYSVFTNLITGSKDLFKTIDYAAAVGSPYFHHTVYPVFDASLSYKELFDVAVSKATEIAKYCESKGLTLLYEPQGYYFNGKDGLGQFVNTLKEKCNVGVCGDFGNPAFADEEAYDVLSELVADIKHVHVKDYLYKDSPIADVKGYRSRGGKHIYDTGLFDGDINNAKCLGMVKKNGYDSFISLEFVADDEKMKASMAKLKELWNNL